MFSEIVLFSINGVNAGIPLLMLIPELQLVITFLLIDELSEDKYNPSELDSPLIVLSRIDALVSERLIPRNVGVLMPQSIVQFEIIGAPL